MIRLLVFIRGGKNNLKGNQNNHSKSYIKNNPMKSHEIFIIAFISLIGLLFTVQIFLKKIDKK